MVATLIEFSCNVSTTWESYLDASISPYMIPSEPAFKITANCGHSNWFVNPLPKPGEPVYCYRCSDYQTTVLVDFPLGTSRRNTRLVAAPREMCKRGHLFTEENTWTSKKTGKRHCRKCKADRQRLERAGLIQ